MPNWGKKIKAATTLDNIKKLHYISKVRRSKRDKTEAMSHLHN
jgi:hypothetical protein